MIQGTFHGTRGELIARLHQLPAMLSGRQPDPTGTADRMRQALGVEALSILKEAFVEKARGGTDAAGITWQKLSPRTIAYSRTHPGLNAKRKRAAKAGRAGRPLLTAKQDLRWRQIFAGAYRRLNAAGADNPGGNAAALAWGVLKREGAKTILSEYGGTKVEILRSSGRLLNSLSPGAPGNVLRSGPGEVTVGTDVQYAAAQHNGNPARGLPARPLWPEEGRPWPQEWQDRMLQVVEDFAGDLARQLTGG